MQKKRKNSASTWTDPDDAPALTDAWFQSADLYKGRRLVRRGRPRLAAPKVQTTLRLDPDILAHYRKSGAGWHAKITQALRKPAGLGKR